LWVPTPADVLSIALGSSPVQFVSLVLNGIVLVVLYDITDFYLILFRYLYHGAHGGGIQACQFGGYCCRTVRRNTCTRSISLYRMSANMESGRRTCFGRTAGHLWLAMAFLGRWSHLHSCCHRLVPAFFRPSVSRKKTEQEEEEIQQKGGHSPWRDWISSGFASSSTPNATVFMALRLIWIIPVFWKENYGCGLNRWSVLCRLLTDWSVFW
jgi:hypothetical protein